MAALAGDNLVDAQATFQEGQPVVSFRFDSIGAQRFGDTTRNNVGRLFAIVLDDEIISAPVIREPILGGRGVISGSFTTQEAQDLALLLRAGALPAEVVTVADLIQWLRGRDEAADLALQKPELVKAALDAKIVRHDTPLGGARIVALFPPMTGG